MAGKGAFGVCVIGLGLLVGCAGGGTANRALLPFEEIPPNPSPVANSAIISPSQDDGRTFRAYFAQGADGWLPSDSASTKYGVVKITVLDSTRINVRTTTGATQSYTYQSTSGGWDTYVSASSGGATLEINRFSYGFRIGNVKSVYPDNNFGSTRFYGFGHVSQPGNLTGTAVYTNPYAGLFLAQQNGPRKFTQLLGNTNLTANFTQGTISGQVFDNSAATTDPYNFVVSVSNANINGNAFVSGTTLSMSSASDPSLNVSSQSGQAAGEFIGQFGTVVTGAFGGTIGTTATSGAANWTYSGTFNAN